MQEALVEQFLKNSGAPVDVCGDSVVQSDALVLPERAVVEVKFCGYTPFANNAAVLSLDRGGKIYLSDGSAVTVVQIWDEPGLPRNVSHRVECGSGALRVHNKYRIHHRSGLVTEDSYTGNAGMVVTTIETNRRRYECSNGIGPFNKSDLVFDVVWRPFG
jgi:hypothetical protein